MTADRFTVDTDALAALIERMTACEERLERLTADVDTVVRDVHGTWTGLAAEAQQAAHDRWRVGLLEMRQALADLKTCSTTAQDNYEAAGNANLEMWEAAQC